MRRWAGRIAVGVSLFIAAVAVLSTVTMLLWNALIPSLFGGPSLSLVQAAGLLLLSHILFRGWSPRHGCGWGRERWRRRFEKRLASMSPEERERFREAWTRRCGSAPKPQGDSGTTSG